MVRRELSDLQGIRYPSLLAAAQTVADANIRTVRSGSTIVRQSPRNATHADPVG